MRVAKIVLAALCLLPLAPRPGHAAACSGNGVPEALALVQGQCCPARNHGAFVSCATRVLKPLVKAGQLQASCKHVIFKAGCPATTTTTTPPESTTTTAPSATTTTSAPEATTTTSMATTSSSTSSSSTSSTTPESTTTTHHGHTTTTVEEMTTTTSSAPPSSTTSTSGPVETTTTSPASSTTSTTGGEVTTTSSTAPGETTTTSTPGATSTTTTTLGGEPGPREICGNCIDDDGNGLTDFEDPACCMQTQSFTMDVTRGLLRPRGATTRLKLKSILAQAGLADVNPLAQDVFVQIRPVGSSTDVLCAKAPADKFMKMHGAFKFWDRHHLVASAKGINDILVKVRKDGSVRFSAVGKRVEFATPAAGTLQVTVGFRNPATAESGNRCSTQTRAFRTGRNGRLLAP